MVMDNIYKSDSIIDSIKGRIGGEVEKAVKTSRFMVFLLGERRFAIATANVKEVNSLEKVYFFPKIDPWIMGLVNLRGDVHSLLSLKEALKEETGGQERIHLIYQKGEMTTAVAIDDIDDVIDVPEENITAYPDETVGNLYISGLIEFKGKRAVIIDLDRIVRELYERMEQASGF